MKIFLGVVGTLTVTIIFLIGMYTMIEFIFLPDKENCILPRNDAQMLNGYNN